ncbi:MAG: glycosyltransferase [Bryobacteraceae bacterium]
MPIALDATYSIGSELSGIGVYCREMLQGLASLHPKERFTWCYRPHRYLKGRSALRPSNCKPILMHDRFIPREQVFHGLNQRMPERSGVCTFHDLFVMTGDYSTSDFRERFTRLSRDAAERSDLIIAVSQFTADQVHELLRVERSRIRVVHHGVTDFGRDAVERKPIILHVGAIQHRKNLIRLIEASNRPRAATRTGGFRRIRRRKSERIRSNSRIEHTASRIWSLPSAWRHQFCIFFDEGFGMPVLEAIEDFRDHIESLALRKS